MLLSNVIFTWFLIFFNNYLFLLACYPFEGEDPFIIKEMPDVFFVSNQSSYQTSLKKNTNGTYYIKYDYKM